ncbi:hypothetical protein MMU07_03130 [Aquiflexum sp. LQ15W]|uniref:hypothetical protein n=1 Tax=Cognataquiflexum nitidum TaxID=2922272 RepID=UPI001F12AEC9|nr:hypothetical protein [Cognataquiflexum nitidum]MCH6198558.1 hypothetical protein [Cognataquiflexum nitidum]
MNPEFKLLIRSISSYVMIFSGVLILFWFLFVMGSSIMGFNFFSSEALELMVFIFLMGISIIGVAAVINISLSIDLIADAKIKELNLPTQPRNLGKRMVAWTLGVIGVLVLLAFIGNYSIKRTHLRKFQTLTSDVVQSHQDNLVRIFEYMGDTAKILETKKILSQVSGSSNKILGAEVILNREIQGESKWVEITSGTDSSALVNQEFEQLIIILSGDEKKLIQELADGTKAGAQVLELENGEIKGYYPISKNGKSMVVRLIPMPESRGSRN